MRVKSTNQKILPDSRQHSAETHLYIVHLVDLVYLFSLDVGARLSWYICNKTSCFPTKTAFPFNNAKFHNSTFHHAFISTRKWLS